MKEPSFLSDFTQHHNFTIRDYVAEDEQGIRWLGEIKTVLDKAFAGNFRGLIEKKEPTWGALFSMIDRVYGHESAALGSFFTRGRASLEIVVRAVIEAAVEVMFVTEKHRAERLGAHGANYSRVWRNA